jgi:hypothetical protein
MSKSIQWAANHGRLKMYLEPSDRVYYRKINYNGNPESLGTGNEGKTCIAIIGIKEIEGEQKICEFRGREEFAGLSVEISVDDSLFSCEIDSRGYPASIGLSNVGKNVTVIVRETVPLQK